MNKEYSTGGIAVRLWFFTWVTFSVGFGVFEAFEAYEFSITMPLLAGVVSCLGSIPAFLILVATLAFIRDGSGPLAQKILLLILLEFFICCLYGYASADFEDGSSYLETFTVSTGVLLASTIVSTIINYRAIASYFSANDLADPSPPLITNNKTENLTTMNNDYPVQPQTPNETSYANKVIIKAAITGALILAMLIPTVFITNLVGEREQRQQEVVAEVSDKWAKPQTLSGPYIVVPHLVKYVDSDKKEQTVRQDLILLPEDLNVSGNIVPEERKRSIYTVLLYKASLAASGRFDAKLPADVQLSDLVLNEAKICVGLNDFKGIEEKVSVNVGGTSYDLAPGLPTNEVDSAGLSAAFPLTAGFFSNPVPFNFDLKLKGSQQLSFLPLSGNSSYTLTSSWPSPSFDGASLPSERQVSDSGFSAKWSFNKANLPFNTVLHSFKAPRADFAFGISMVQPADQYAKTLRSAKYAILVIGLTFSLFFITELMQRRPVHPVQYVLVGMALVIFYTLLLSISEYIVFDQAYLVAATATVLLITLYAKGHFANWAVAGLFALVLSLLYTFIFILIRLQDTGLLVGSIGLFAVLALVMYASRKINWYHPTFGKSQLETV